MGGRVRIWRGGSGSVRRRRRGGFLVMRESVMGCSILTVWWKDEHVVLHVFKGLTGFTIPALYL
jgi:hypothetical protein